MTNTQTKNTVKNGNSKVKKAITKKNKVVVEPELTIQELALKLTKENLVKSTSSRVSTNSYIVDILKDGGKKTRIELVNEITILRLEQNAPVVATDFQNSEFLAKFTKVNKTAKNAVDASMAKGTAKSNFCNSSFSDKYELIQNDDKTYSLEVK